MAVAPNPGSPLMQILAQCREEPIIVDDFAAEICPALEEVILQHTQTDRSTKSLNVGGWKSREDFFLWPDEAVRQFGQFLASELGVSRIVAWAMVNRAGSQHPRHQHRAAVLTGIYYVTAGSEDAITPTIFETSSGDLEVEPHPGRLVLCRGEMWHRVPPYPGDLPRVTIAFDVRR